MSMRTHGPVRLRDKSPSVQLLRGSDLKRGTIPLASYIFFVLEFSWGALAAVGRRGSYGVSELWCFGTRSLVNYEITKRQ